MNNLLQKLFYCLNERHFSAEMYVINPDALFNTSMKATAVHIVMLLY